MPVSRRAVFPLALGVIFTAASWNTVSAQQTGGCTPEDAANMAVIQRWIDEVYGDENVDALDELAVTDFDPSDPDLAPGIEAWKTRTAAYLVQMKGLIPDVTYAIADMIAASGKVAVRGSIAGTSTAGKLVNATFINLIGFRDGKMAEYWGVTDIGAIYDAL